MHIVFLQIECLCGSYFILFPQLFTKPHPPRSGSKKDGSSPSHPTPFFFQLDKLKTSAEPFRGTAIQPQSGQVGCKL